MQEYDYFLDYMLLKLISSIKPGNDATENIIHCLKYMTSSNTKMNFKNLRQVGILILTSKSNRYSKSVFQ